MLHVILIHKTQYNPILIIQLYHSYYVMYDVCVAHVFIETHKQCSGMGFQFCSFSGSEFMAPCFGRSSSSGPLWTGGLLSGSADPPPCSVATWSTICSLCKAPVTNCRVVQSQLR